MIATNTFAENRAEGSVGFDVRAIDGVTRRGQLHESGSLRVRFPSPEDNGLSAVFINTAGGIAGGDRFKVAIKVGENARLTATTAAAEKVYRSHGPPAQIDVNLQSAAGSRLLWLPQETILFNQSRTERRIDIDISRGASLMLCESIVFGRTAMGETFHQGALADRWRLRMDGRLVLADTLRLGGDVSDRLSNPAVAKGGVAVGTILIAPGDDAVVARIREVADGFRGEVGVSSWNGIALARLVAQDASHLRADLMAALARASDAPLPRLWLN